jgi:hypothetical protein
METAPAKRLYLTGKGTKVATKLIILLREKSCYEWLEALKINNL